METIAEKDKRFFRRALCNSYMYSSRGLVALTKDFHFLADRHTQASM